MRSLGTINTSSLTDLRSTINLMQSFCQIMMHMCFLLAQSALLFSVASLCHRNSSYQFSMKLRLSHFDAAVEVIVNKQQNIKQHTSKACSKGHEGGETQQVACP